MQKMCNQGASLISVSLSISVTEDVTNTADKLSSCKLHDKEHAGLSIYAGNMT